MPVQIQLRRGSTSEWTSANPVLALGEVGVDTTTKQFRIGDGSSQWSALSAQGFTNAVVYNSAYTAKGTLLGASAPYAPAALAVGANDQILVADSSTTVGMKWTSTLASPIVTSPTITGTIGGSPTITAPTITGTVTASSATFSSPTLTTPTINSPTINTPLLVTPKENWQVSATVATGTINVDVLTGVNWYYTSNASANWTFNFRGNGTTSMDSTLSTGQSVTVGFAVTNGTTAYRPTVFQVDGTAVTPKWQGGTAPTAGSASSVDAYVFTIIKTGSATFTVLASQTRFA